MNKSEIQVRIEKCESELATLKADLAKCEDGIEEEKCWFAVTNVGGVGSVYARTKQEAANCAPSCRPAYMPECRQVTESDLQNIWKDWDGYMTHKEFAERAHKLGFRMKVTP